MIRNKNGKENKKINKIAESLAAVHTHTHTLYCLLVKNKNVNNAVNINYKDRTMLFLNSMGLSLFAFVRGSTVPKLPKSKGLVGNFQKKKSNLIYIRYRAGPV